MEWYCELASLHQTRGKNVTELLLQPKTHSIETYASGKVVQSTVSRHLQTGVRSWSRYTATVNTDRLFQSFARGKSVRKMKRSFKWERMTTAWAKSSAQPWQISHTYWVSVSSSLGTGLKFLDAIEWQFLVGFCVIPLCSFCVKDLSVWDATVMNWVLCANPCRHRMRIVQLRGESLLLPCGHRLRMAEIEMAWMECFAASICSALRDKEACFEPIPCPHWLVTCRFARHALCILFSGCLNLFKRPKQD